MSKKRHSYKRSANLPVVEVNGRYFRKNSEILKFRDEVTRCRKRKEREERLFL